MGGRALGAAFGAAAQAFILVAGAAYAAEVPAEVQPAGLASTPPAVPAGDSDLSQVPAPASAAEDEPSVGPAAAPDGEIAREPADATDTAATPPSDTDQSRRHGRDRPATSSRSLTMPSCPAMRPRLLPRRGA